MLLHLGHYSDFMYLVLFSHPWIIRCIDDISRLTIWKGNKEDAQLLINSNRLYTSYAVRSWLKFKYISKKVRWIHSVSLMTVVIQTFVFPEVSKTHLHQSDDNEISFPVKVNTDFWLKNLKCSSECGK